MLYIVSRTHSIEPSKTKIYMEMHFKITLQGLQDKMQTTNRILKDLYYIRYTNKKEEPQE